VAKVEFHSRQGFTSLMCSSLWEVTQLSRRSIEASGLLSLGVYPDSVNVGSVGEVWRTGLQSLYFHRTGDLLWQTLFIHWQTLFISLLRPLQSLAPCRFAARADVTLMHTLSFSRSSYLMLA
jgi:hypothetical protein